MSQCRVIQVIKGLGDTELQETGGDHGEGDVVLVEGILRDDLGCRGHIGWAKVLEEEMELI